MLEELAPGRAATRIESLRLTPSGITPADMVCFIDDNLSAIGMRTIRGDLSQSVQSRRPFIAVLDNGHAVLVHEIREVSEQRFLVIRDPLHGAYLEAFDEFDSRLVRDTTVLAFPAIWGEP